ncbi:hypothetical protein C8R45DRAFT_939563 [Mycena sanguinolenta]|nr:hypothetical protein C8R45DRAFT_939563 [Mycena sanguinolenta]
MCCSASQLTVEEWEENVLVSRLVLVFSQVETGTLPQPPVTACPISHRVASGGYRNASINNFADSNSAPWFRTGPERNKFNKDEQKDHEMYTNEGVVQEGFAEMHGKVGCIPLCAPAYSERVPCTASFMVSTESMQRKMTDPARKLSPSSDPRQNSDIPRKFHLFGPSVHAQHDLGSRTRRRLWIQFEHCGDEERSAIHRLKDSPLGE